MFSGDGDLGEVKLFTSKKDSELFESYAGRCQWFDSGRFYQVADAVMRLLQSNVFCLVQNCLPS